MSEPGEGVKPPISTIENPAAKGWLTVDTLTGQEDFVISPEQKAETERLAARKGMAMLVVDTVIPSRTIEELVAQAKANTPKAAQEPQQTQPPVADDGDWVGLDDIQNNPPSRPLITVSPSREHVEALIKAQALQKEQQLFKQAFVEQIATTHIPEADLQEYTSAVYAAANDIAPPNRNLIYTLETFVDSSESSEQARLFAQFARQWKERFLATAPDDRVRYNRTSDFSQLIYGMSGAHKLPKPEPRNPEEMTALFEAMVEVYDAAYALPENEENQRVVNTLTNGARDLGLRTRNPDQIRKVLQLYKEVANEPNKVLVEKMMDAVIIYGRSHGLTEDAAHGFLEKLLPAMRSNDSQVAILTEGGNIWGMRPGDFGAADFLCHAYALRVTPAHINELLMAAREVPTTVLSRLEQNRLDAPALDGHLRELVHDQRPYVHDLLQAALQFYETGDRQSLTQTLERSRVYEKGTYPGQFDGLSKILFEKDFYERQVEETIQGTKRPAKALDVVKRLVENTKPVADIPPTTSNRELNTRLQIVNTEAGRILPKEVLQAALDYVNSGLTEMMDRKEVGIEPAHVQAIAWLERKAFETLQNLRYEDQLGAYRQDWFISILRLQELTASPHAFSEAEFQKFIEQVRDASSMADAYRLVASHTLENTAILARRYKEKGKEDTGALWSGNATHELVGLTDLRPATTAYGGRHREEALRPEEERLRGD